MQQQSKVTIEQLPDVIIFHTSAALCTVLVPVSSQSIVISVPFSDIYGDCTIYDIGISAGDIGPINKKAIRDEICAMKQKRLDEKQIS